MNLNKELFLTKQEKEKLLTLYMLAMMSMSFTMPLIRSHTRYLKVLLELTSDIHIMKIKDCMWYPQNGNHLSLFKIPQKISPLDGSPNGNDLTPLQQSLVKGMVGFSK